MCRLNFPKSFFSAKTVAAFTMAICAGLFFNSIFGGYIVGYTFEETFTRAEAEAKLNERVTETCLENLGNIDGTVVSYKRERGGQITVAVKFDKPILEKFDTISFDKETFQKCMKQTD